MDLSVVVVSYNVRQLLSGCLASVFQGLADGPLTHEVLVVDNASGDGSADMVRDAFPQARLVRNERNVGFAAASNQALQLSQGRYMLLLNPDTRVLGQAIQIMLSFMEDTPRAGMAGPALLYGDGAFQHSAFHFPSLAQIFFDFFPAHHRLLDSGLNGRYPRRWYRAGGPFPIDHPLGAVMLVRREAVNQVGLLDERFFMYCEEIDWAMRMHKAGWQAFTCPQAMFIHYAGQSTQQFRDAMFVALWRSRQLLFQKHYSPAFRRAARLLIHLGLWSEERRARRMGLEATALRVRLDAYARVRGMADGVQGGQP